MSGFYFTLSKSVIVLSNESRHEVGLCHSVLQDGVQVTQNILSSDGYSTLCMPSAGDGLTHTLEANAT